MEAENGRDAAGWKAVLGKAVSERAIQFQVHVNQLMSLDISEQVLMYKNYKVAVRNRLSTLLRVLFAPLVVLALWGALQTDPSSMSQRAFSWLTRPAANVLPPATTIGGVPRCTAPLFSVDDADCFTIVYSPFDDPFAHEVMATVARRNTPELTIGALGDIDREYDVVAFESRDAMLRFIQGNSNSVASGMPLLLMSDLTDLCVQR